MAQVLKGISSERGIYESTLVGQTKLLSQRVSEILNVSSTFLMKRLADRVVRRVLLATFGSHLKTVHSQLCISIPTCSRPLHSASSMLKTHGTVLFLSMGPKKHINFFNINFLVPTQNPPFWAPRKKFDVPHFLGKNAKKGPT